VHEDYYYGGYRSDLTETSDLGLRFGRAYIDSFGTAMSTTKFNTRTKYLTASDSTKLIDSVNIAEWYIEGDTLRMILNSDTTLYAGWASANSAAGGVDTFYTNHSNRFTLGTRWSYNTNPGVALSSSGYNLYEMLIFVGKPSDIEAIQIREYLDGRYSTPYVP
jgi:hypothetical protein